MKIIKLQIISAILIFTAGVFTANAAAPANDNLANAINLSNESGAIIGTIAEATRENGEDNHTRSSEAMVYKTVWYRWTAPATCPVSFYIYETAPDFDSAIAVSSSFAPQTTPGMFCEAKERKPTLSNSDCPAIFLHRHWQI